MKTIRTFVIGIFLISISIASCQTPKDSTVLVVQGNYSLTKNDLDRHLTQLKNVLGELSKEEIQSEKLILIEMFKEAPLETLASLKEDVAITPTPSPIPEPHYNNTSLALGHLKVREVLDNDIGKMQFDSKAANSFRDYLAVCSQINLNF